MRALNDHIMMLKPNGLKKAISIETINFWINNNIFDKVGYKFIDEESAKRDIKAFNAHQARIMAKTKLAGGTIMRDGGEAEAHVGAVTKIESPEVPIEALTPGFQPDAEPPPSEIVGAKDPEVPPAPETVGAIPGIEVSDVLEE